MQPFCVAATVIAAVGLAGAAFGQNALMNGGFEEVSGPAGLELPDGWILDAAAESATAPVRSGSRSLALLPVSSLQGVAAQGDPFIGGMDQMIGVTPGDEVTFGVWAQTLSTDTINGTGHRANIEMLFYNTAGQVVGLDIATIFDGALDGIPNIEDEWVFGEITMEAPESAVGVIVVMALEVDFGAIGQGAVYWDDARLVVPAPGAAGVFGLGAVALRRRRRAWLEARASGLRFGSDQVREHCVASLRIAC